MTTIEIPVSPSTKGRRQIVIAPRAELQAALDALAEALGASEISDCDEPDGAT